MDFAPGVLKIQCGFTGRNKLTEVNISQAYQLIIGRVVASEDRQELMEQNLAKFMQAVNERMDDMWDSILKFFDDVQGGLPDRKIRVSYPSHSGPGEGSREPPGGF